MLTFICLVCVTVGAVGGVFLGYRLGYRDDTVAKYQVGDCVVFQKYLENQQVGVVLKISKQTNDIHSWPAPNAHPTVVRKYEISYQIDPLHAKLVPEAHREPWEQGQKLPDYKSFIWVSESDIVGRINDGDD